MNIKSKKQFIAAFFTVTSLLGVVFSASAPSALAETAGACPADTVSFVLGGGVSKGADGTATVAPSVICCCDANKFRGVTITHGSTPKCPTQNNACKPLNIGVVSRSDFLAAPDDNNQDLTVDTNSPLYPLKDLAKYVGNWYTALFYLAVVLAIIQIFRGGIEYSIAAGNSSKTEEAKGYIVEAVVGLGVALLAAGILVLLRGPNIFSFS